MNHQIALQEIEKFVKVFKAFDEAKNAITSLASLDQNVKELELKKINILTALELEIERLDSFRSIAKAEKEKLQQDSKSFIEQLKNKEEKKQNNLLTEFNALKENLENQFDILVLKNEREEQKLKVLNKEVLDKGHELSSLENKVLEVRKQIAQLLK